MTKRNQLLLLLVSLLASSFSVYRMTYHVSRRGMERYVHAIVIGLSACMILYILYRTFIKRMSKGRIDPANYARLFELEATTVSGELEFYFTIEQAKQAKFSILSKDLKEVQVVRDEQFKSGGHIVRFDASTLENGVYFYCLETENQKTMKRMLVQHDKLTV